MSEYCQYALKPFFFLLSRDNVCLTDYTDAIDKLRCMSKHGPMQPDQRACFMAIADAVEQAKERLKCDKQLVTMIRDIEVPSYD